MLHKPAKYNFITFLLIFTVFFSNISSEIFAEPESASQTTTQAAPSIVHNYASDGKELALNARAAILIDVPTGAVIYEKNAHERLYPASITKILTSYIACTEGNLDDTLTVSQSAIDGMGQGGSSIGLVPGEKIGFRDALYGILLESANEACMAVAEHMCGSASAFAAKMNETAKAIGCTESNFVNPHGFHDPNQYTTCYDMALITSQAIKNEDFSFIWGTVSHQIPATNLNPSRYLNHKDRMLRPTSDYYYPDLMGGKTGFTDEAGNTLVSFAEKDGAELIAVVMKADSYDNSYGDTKTLLDYGFSLYKGREIVFSATDYYTTAKVIQPYKNKVYELGTVGISAGSDIFAALPSFINKESITIKPEIEPEFEAPVAIDEIVGKINVCYNDKVIETLDAVAVTNAPALSDKELARRALKDNLRKYVMIPFMGLIVLFLLFLAVLFVQSVAGAITGKKKKKKKKRRRPPEGAHPRKHGKKRRKKRRPPQHRE